MTAMKEIYFDNSATTALSPAVKAAMCEAMERFGNPSSLHTGGTEAALALRTARREVGAALGEAFLRDGQLIFTSCGTEATALALWGSAHAKARRTANTILTTDSEHPSVEESLKRLEGEGFSVVRVPTRGGAPDMDTVREHCNQDLFMVSVMLVNNETGARYPVEEVFRAARAGNPECICHTDAVQGFLKVPFTAKGLGADLITLSAHKIHGPKGVGALYIAPEMLTKKKIIPFLPGGGQEFGFRSGTENTIGIAGFAAAAKEGAAQFRTSAAGMLTVSEHLIRGFAKRGIAVNLPPVRAPHIVSLTLPDIKSETMLHFLAQRGIAVSSGSACSSHARHPSRTLLAFGLTPAQADCTLRVSLSGENTIEEADALLAALDEGIATLVRIHR